MFTVLEEDAFDGLEGVGRHVVGDGETHVAPRIRVLMPLARILHLGTLGNYVASDVDDLIRLMRLLPRVWVVDYGRIH